MNLRNFIEKLDAENRLVRIKKEVSTEFEIPNVLAALDGKVVLFANVKGSEFPVIGDLVSSRDLREWRLASGGSRFLRSCHMPLTI